MDIELRAEALAGPFEAVIADRYGHVIKPAEIRDADDPDELEVSIRRRTALPSGPDADGNRRLSGITSFGDVVTEWSGFDDHDEVETCWVQAEAMTAGLNAASNAR
jgi:hypothetical protein